MSPEYIFLDVTRQRDFDAKYQEICTNTFKYGFDDTNVNDDKLIGEPCWRVKSTEKVTVNDEKYKKYVIGFIYYHEYNPHLEINNPNNLKEISHFCGNVKNSEQSLCIRGDHMNLETPKTNKDRRNCHNYIRQYQRKYNKYKKITLQTKGTLTVKIVNKQKRKLRYDRKTLHICCHYPECFINYGKIL